MDPAFLAQCQLRLRLNAQGRLIFRAVPLSWTYLSCFSSSDFRAGGGLTVPCSRRGNAPPTVDTAPRCPPELLTPESVNKVLDVYEAAWNVKATLHNQGISCPEANLELEAAAWVLWLVYEYFDELPLASREVLHERLEWGPSFRTP